MFVDRVTWSVLTNERDCNFVFWRHSPAMVTAEILSKFYFHFIVCVFVRKAN